MIKRSMKRGQAAIELLVFVSIAVLLLVTYVAISNYYLGKLYEKEGKMDADDFLQEIITEFDTAGRVENGYTRVVELPKKINYEDYGLYIGGVDLDYKSTSPMGDPREIVVYAGEKEFVRKMSVNVFKDTTSYPRINSEKGCLVISKMNNIVFWSHEV